MSSLIKEDEDYLYLKGYIHGNNDEYSSWELDSDGNQKYSQGVHEVEHYSLMEFEIEYRIDKETGDLIYTKFDGMELPT